MVPAFPLVGPIPGGPELLIILMVLVLLFGAQKIPKLARATGESIGEFRKGRQELEEDLQEVQTELENESADIQQAVEQDLGGADSEPARNTDTERTAPASETASEPDPEPEPEPETEREREREREQA